MSALTDPLSRTVSFSYDSADRMTTQTLPDTHSIGFAYDEADNMTSLTPPGRPAHTLTYTPIDGVASYTPPPLAGTGPTGYVFNLDRQPTEVQRPDGETTIFTYGGTNGRLTGITFSRGTLGLGYDGAGRLSTITDPGGVDVTFTYDGALPVGETWSGGVEGSVLRSFTNNFELATESVNGGHTVSFSYDADRLLTSAGTLTIARHPEHGLVTGTTLGVTTETYEHNEFGEERRHTAIAGSTSVFDVQSTRDDRGRIVQRIEVVDGITRLFQYGFDPAGRLRTVTRNGDVVVIYTYDANGNRLSAEGEAGLVSATYDDQDRLLTYGASTYAYAPNGELASSTIAGQATSYVYDTFGNLTSVTRPNGDVIAYVVDGRGRRVGKLINGTLVKAWLYADQLRPIAELDGDGNVVSRFVYATKATVPDYIVRGGVAYRVFSDHLGSPRVVVDTTTGAIVQRLDFGAFGEVIQDSSPGWQPFGFAGGLADPDTGLLRFGMRDYDPTTGRWLSKDPIGFFGGDSDLYAYAFNDPVNLADASGTLVPAGALALGGAIIGAASGFAGAIAQEGYTPATVAAGTIMGAMAGAAGALGPARAAMAALVAVYADAEGQLVSAAATPCPDDPNFSSLIGAGLGGAQAELMKKALMKVAANATPLTRVLAAVAPSLPASILPIVGTAIGKVTGF
jgi:RHS repeat-associated protein